MLTVQATGKGVVYLSIVVATNRPVRYLEGIFRNIRLTSPLNLEIIVVNDDPKRKISESEFVGFFPEKALNHEIILNLKIINNNHNSGPGYSRNRGLEKAKGTYLLFIDDDDELDLSILRSLLDFKDSPDIICLGFEDTSGVFTNYDLQNKLPKHKIFKIQALQQAFLENTFLPAQIQPYLFKKEFLIRNKIKFPDAYVGEDLAFNAMAMLGAKTALNIPGSFYKYISRPGTLKSSQGVDRTLDLLRCLSELNNFKNQFAIMDNTSRELCYEIIEFYQSLFCMRALLASNKTENFMSKSGFFDSGEVQIFKSVFDNKASVNDLKNLIEKIADDIKKICIDQLIPFLENFETVFVYCVGSLGRAVARLVSEGCRKEVIFVDAMFDKFSGNEVDGLRIMGPEDLFKLKKEKCVIICNPQPAIERKIEHSIKNEEFSSGLKKSKLLFGSQLIKESASSFFGKCEVVF